MNTKTIESLVQVSVAGLVIIAVLSLPYCATKKIDGNKQKCYDLGGHKAYSHDRGTAVACYTEDGRLIEVIR